MSDDQNLEFLKRRKLLEMRRRLLKKKNLKQKKEAQVRQEDPQKVLRNIFVGRGWEVWKAAEQQYPTITRKILPELLSLLKTGRIREKITGEQLFWLFRRLGLRIKLNTKIRISEKGKLKTIADKLKES
jgi:DNA-binding TFAR19-related protein (PDSD5 family)